MVATVGSDHSVTVHRVPRSWYEDDPSCETILSLPGVSTASTQPLGAPFKVEWVLKGSSYLLAVGMPDGVIVFDPERSAHVSSWEGIIKGNKVLRTDGVSASHLKHSLDHG